MASDIWKFVRLLSLFLMFVNTLYINAKKVVENSSEDFEEVATTAVFWEETLFLELTEPEEIAYVYKIKPAKNFGVKLNFTLTDVELVPAVPRDACSPITNSMHVYGNIAFVERGACSFLSKAIIAEKAGAKAIVVMDNNIANDETLIDMVDDGSHRTTHISAFFLLGKDGFMIRQCLERLHLQYAVINIPINATLVPYLPRSQPPWSIWS